MPSLGCDIGFKGEPTVATTPVTVVMSGTNIGPGSNYTLDQPIRIQFNRFLNPETVTRQSILLENSSGTSFTNAPIAYDPVTLTVSVSNPGTGQEWLTAGQQYRIVINVPSTASTGDGSTVFGLQAIDGATLAAPQTLVFAAGAAANPPYAGPPTIDYCRDIQWAIFTCSCSYAGCHEAPQPMAASLDAGTGYPVLGLSLASPDYVRMTAIGQVADESNTGPLASVATPSPTQPFGVDMAIIAAGQPGNSWMLYKTLLAVNHAPEALPFYFDAGLEDAPAAMSAPDAAEDAPGSMTPGAPDAAEDAPSTMSPGSPDAAEDAPGTMTPADAGRPQHSDYDQALVSPIPATEITVLSNYILGQSMPYPGPVVSTGQTGLAEGDIERLSLWIAQGANIPPSCAMVEETTCPQ